MSLERLEVLRLFTRGSEARQDYMWWVERLEQDIDLTRSSLLYAFTQDHLPSFKLPKYVFWWEGVRLHLILFSLPSDRKDHVHRDIEAHLHLAWRPQGGHLSKLIGRLLDELIGLQLHEVASPASLLPKLSAYFDQLVLQDREARKGLSLAELTDQLIQVMVSLDRPHSQEDDAPAPEESRSCDLEAQEARDIPTELEAEPKAEPDVLDPVYFKLQSLVALDRGAEKVTRAVLKPLRKADTQTLAEATLSSLHEPSSAILCGDYPKTEHLSDALGEAHTWSLITQRSFEINSAEPVFPSESRLKLIAKRLLTKLRS